MKALFKRSKYIVIASVVAFLGIIAVGIFFPPSSPPDIGLQVEYATYDPFTCWLRVYGTIDYEIPADTQVGIYLISIKDGNRTIDVHEGYGMNSIVLDDMTRKGLHWGLSLSNLKLQSKNLLLTLRYVIVYRTKVLDDVTKQFSVKID